MSAHMKPLKIFRFVLLGSPEVGKTCFCSMYTSHVFFEVYDHTMRAQFYMKSVRTSVLPTFIPSADDLFFLNLCEDGGADGGAGGKKKKKKKGPKKGKKKKSGAGKTGGGKKKKKKAGATRYGVQLQDVPGEINKYVDPCTFEGFALDMVFDKTDPRAVSLDPIAEVTEETPLRRMEWSSRSAEVERNRLHDKTKPHAFIVMFDARHDVNQEKPQSLDKALLIVEELLEKFQDMPKPPPIVLFGNKLDMFENVDTAKRLYRNHTEECRRRLNGKVKTGKGGLFSGKSGKHEPVSLYYGSVRRNECWKMEKGGVAEEREDALTLDQLVDRLAQHLDGWKLGSVGDAYLKLQKEEKERKIRESMNKGGGGGKGGGGDEGGEGGAWCSGCRVM